MLEWYAADETYRDLMDRCEMLLGHIAGRLGYGQRLRRGPHRVDLRPPWERITVEAAFDRYSDTSPDEALAQNRFDEILALQIEPNLGVDRPVFLCDYPARCGAMARRKPDRPEVAERFELYIAGLELCNGFSELTDPAEQRRRFTAELVRRRGENLSALPMPEAFLTALSHMPPAAGNAMGIDRLVMLFAGADTIDEVTAFVPEEV
jgi:lysyl-tRNA synthetase class 2